MPGPDAPDAPPRVDLHAVTKLTRARLLADHPVVDHNNPPALRKRYPGAARAPLPVDWHVPGPRAPLVLSGARGRRTGPLTARRLARLLFLACGVTRPGAARGAGLRAAPSAGGLAPVEVYVATGASPGLDPQLAHVDPDDPALVTLRRGDHRARLWATTGRVRHDLDAVAALCGLPERTGWRYGARGYRHLWWDAGTMLANLELAARADGIEVEVATGFADAVVADLLGVGDPLELPLVLVGLSSGRAPAPGRAPPAPSPPPPAEPVLARPVLYPYATEFHRESALEGDTVAGWARREPPPAPVRHGRPPLPVPSAGGRADTLVLRRGSTTRFAVEPVGPSPAMWALGVAERALPLAPHSSAGATPAVAVHALDGVPAGLGHWAGGALAIGSPQDSEVLRVATAAVCADQDHAGEAALVAFWLCDLARVDAALGARGYRVAQLEAGWRVGRLALAAQAAGLGACPVTFLDEEVAELFGTTAQPLLAAAVGRPRRRALPGRRPVGGSTAGA